MIKKFAIILCLSMLMMVLSCFGFTWNPRSRLATKWTQYVSRIHQEPVSSEVKALIDHDVAAVLPVVYTTSTCPYCTQAVEILQSSSSGFKEVQLDKISNGAVIRLELKNRTGRTSVPSVWIGGAYVGGLNDGGLGGLATLSKSGQLTSLLKELGVLKMKN